MSMNKYKGLIRGAFALTISYLERTDLDRDSRDKLKAIVKDYLRDNGLDLDKFPNSNGLVTKILRAGEDVYFSNKSMDEALERLSKGIRINL